MLKAERFQTESELPVVDAPFVRQIKKFPFAAAFGTAVIMSVLFFPSRIFLRRIPYDLGVGAH